MKKSSFLKVLMAALIVVGSAGLGHAGDLKVSGYADILYFISNEGADLTTSTTNATEQQFIAHGEVDFEKEVKGKTGTVTFRLDLDFPSAGLLAGQVLPGGAAGGILLGGNNIAGGHLEQAKFHWAIPAGPLDLGLTGGIFNSPIGYESQDAIDRTFITYGQLFGLVPSNLAGIEVSLGIGLFSASILYTDEWRGLTKEENSFGGTIGLEFNPAANLYFGFLTSEQNIAVQDEDIVDIRFSGKAGPQSWKIFYAAEFLVDTNNRGLGITVGFVHNTPILAHGVAIRVDSVDCDAGSAYLLCGGAAVTPTTSTLAAWLDLADNLTAKLEWSTFDPDGAATADGETTATTDAILLQFIASFM